MEYAYNKSYPNLKVSICWQNSGETQQVAKNIIFNQDKTLIRKIGELFGAYDLEKNYSKEEILALYVNTNYFGDGYYGIYDASMGYYNKNPKDLQ